MIDELSEMGIMMDTAGPGQHVPVVERKIQKVKERVRAHVNTLPFVMTQLLLTMCVIFCASLLKMQPTRLSTSRISPLEQFTGNKIDCCTRLEGSVRGLCTSYYCQHGQFNEQSYTGVCCIASDW